MTERGPVAIRFGAFLLDPARGVLERDGQIVSVRPKTFALLVLMAANPNRVVSKDELIEGVWGASVVTDDTIAQTIRDVRRALGDRDALRLRSAPKRGYIFSLAGEEPAPSGPAAGGEQRSVLPAAPLETTEPKAASDIERRHLTVLRCDLAGSSDLAARLDPEDLREALREDVLRFTRTVEQSGGYVASASGTDFLAYYGFPRALEGGAGRAVRAALDLVLQSTGPANESAAQLPFKCAVATGLVVIGPDRAADDLRQRPSLVGEPPGLAAHLIALAGPGEIMIAEGTQRLVGNQFELQQVEGDLPAWRVLRVSPTEGRLLAGAQAAISPMVAREEELQLAQRRWDQVKRGRGHVILLQGEPGIGKSRLVQALRDSIRDEPHEEVVYFCTPHHQSSALRPFADQLRRASGLRDDDGLQDKRATVRAFLASFLRDPEADVDLASDLLSLPGDAREAVLALPPNIRKQRLTTMLLEQIVHHAASAPVLVVFEDLHWIDPSSFELLHLLIERTAALPVLLVLTFRPDFAAPWSGNVGSTSLTLARLDKEERLALVEHIARDRVLAPDMQGMIAEKSDGIPLFIEELTKSIIETMPGDDRLGRDNGRAGEPALPIPTTLRDMLFARLDRSPSARMVAQVGAAIGRDFPYTLLRDAIGFGDAELLSALRSLEAAGLIIRLGEAPNALFTFSHALIQDSAYDSLLRNQRREIHAVLARKLGEARPGSPIAAPEQIAHHWAEANFPLKAADYWSEAGDLAFKTAANREASIFFERAILARRDAASTQSEIEIIVDLRRRLHFALYPLGELDRAVDNLAVAERLAETLDDRKPLARILARQTYLFGAIGQLQQALAAGERAISIVAEFHDPDAYTGARLMTARALYAAGRYPEAIAYCQEVVDVLKDDVVRGVSNGVNHALTARIFQILCHAELGAYREATAICEIAGRLCAHPLCSVHEDVWYRVCAGRLALLMGDDEKVTFLLEPVIPVCQGEFAIYFSRAASTLGAAYIRLGRGPEGLSLLESADRQSAKIGFVFGHALALVLLGEGYHALGNSELAQSTLDRALLVARQSGQRGNEARALFALASLYRRAGASDKALQFGRSASALASELGMGDLFAHVEAMLREMA